MNRRRVARRRGDRARRWVAFLTVTSAAFAHAALSPPVAETGVLQQFTLAVPTEKEGATTTEIQLTVPAGVAIDSFEPEPGWKRTVSASGSGEAAVVNRSPGRAAPCPPTRTAVFRFQATLDRRQRDVHVRGAPDLLRRLGGRVDRRRDVGHAQPGDQGRLIDRRRLELDAGDRRDRRGRGGAAARRSSRCSRGGGR